MPERRKAGSLQGNVNALVVSESADWRRFVRSTLDPSWKLAEAADGRTALRMVEDGDDLIQMVIVDETAEPFGAFGLSRELKQLIDPPKVVVVLERRQDQWLARWSGADRWLTRPVDAFALADVASELAAKGARGAS